MWRFLSNKCSVSGLRVSFQFWVPSHKQYLHRGNGNSIGHLKETCWLASEECLLKLLIGLSLKMYILRKKQKKMNFVVFWTYSTEPITLLVKSFFFFCRWSNLFFCMSFVRMSTFKGITFVVRVIPLVAFNAAGKYDSEKVCILQTCFYHEKSFFPLDSGRIL